MGNKMIAIAFDIESDRTKYNKDIDSEAANLIREVEEKFVTDRLTRHDRYGLAIDPSALSLALGNYKGFLQQFFRACRSAADSSLTYNLRFEIDSSRNVRAYFDTQTAGFLGVEGLTIDEGLHESFSECAATDIVDLANDILAEGWCAISYDAHLVLQADYFMSSLFPRA